MSIVRGRKSVPGINSRERGNGKKDYSVFTHGNKHEKGDNIAVLDGMSILSGWKSVPGTVAVKGENGKKDAS
uniref:Uncharacterized protein n=1 Tax=Tanacetum cinerariifolium TaxID=118510 RepID=A0A699TXC0_TANCI|nr:hypothetical protein [Tanacetum cinerariifolium]